MKDDLMYQIELSFLWFTLLHYKYIISFLHQFYYLFSLAPKAIEIRTKLSYF
jgi:hypothetical protein